MLNALKRLFRRRRAPAHPGRHYLRHGQWWEPVSLEEQLRDFGLPPARRDDKPAPVEGSVSAWIAARNRKLT